MEAVEFVVTIYKPTNGNHEIARAIRKMLVWAESKSPYISVSDTKDPKCVYYAENEDESAD